MCFRDLADATNEALALFGNKNAQGIVLLAPFAEYATLADDLIRRFPPGETIIGEDAQREFIRLYGAIVRLRNILTAFDDFAGDALLTDRQLQNYQTVYLDLHQQLRGERDAHRESINDDLVFEIELIKQVEVNVDYVLILLVRQYLDENGPARDEEIRAQIDRAVDSSPLLRNEKDLIVQLVDSLTVDAEARGGTRGDHRQENLKFEETKTFIAMAFRDGALTTAGIAVTHILPPVSRFSAGNAHGARKQSVRGRLAAFFDRYNGLT